MIRLRPMDEAGFRAFLERAIPRRAERWVRRGLWRPEQAEAASRDGYARELPEGLKTPGQYLVDLVDSESGTVVGEAWYSAKSSGGKVEFWIHWICVWPEHRRQGHGSAALELLEEEARKAGAEQTTLSVWSDNPEAEALYRRLGYTTTVSTMSKPVVAAPVRPEL